ncbi:MAG: 2-oxoacid:acceptor oxidoreductase family protein [Dehalococcoidia bacterium]|nr:2-oxoacid:acceptor oxidoreductase family protein [Dehalococcoidia bacterium]
MARRRYEAIFAGIGGMGALLAGQILTRSAATQYEYVIWSPNYTTARRGAPCDCTVVLSDEEIDSPILERVQTIVVVAAPQLKAYEDRVKPGGLIITESSGLVDDVGRKDVKVVKVPALEIMLKRGRRVGSNMVMLGAYVGVTKALPAELVEKGIEKQFAGKEYLSFNKQAFNEGLKLGMELA